MKNEKVPFIPKNKILLALGKFFKRDNNYLIETYSKNEVEDTLQIKDFESIKFQVKCRIRESIPDNPLLDFSICQKTLNKLENLLEWAKALPNGLIRDAYIEVITDRYNEVLHTFKFIEKYQQIQTAVNAIPLPPELK